jgi:xylulokinase
MNILRMHILVIDIGTSALKTTLYAQSGALIAQASAPCGYQSPEPNAAEADPEDWWRALPSALVGLGASLHNVRVIGLTGQMHGAVLLDANNEPVHPCLLWLDRRCAAETAELMAELQLPPYLLNSTYTLPKLMWLARHRPDALRRAKTLLFPKDYVRFKLSGVLCTDASEARGAAMLDLETQCWTPERLRLLPLPFRQSAGEGWGLGGEVFPPLRPPGEVIGTLLPAIADQLHLPRNAQVIVGLGDVAAILGSAPIEPGRVMAAVGTSTMMYAILPEALRDVRDEGDGLTRPDGIYPYDLCGFRLLGGVSSLTGGALDWAWRAFGAASGMGFAEAMAHVSAIEPGANGLVFVPYLAGERSPFWRDDLRGMFIGLNVNHTWAHMLRAVVEGVAFNQRLMLDRFAAVGLPSPRVALSGGAAQHAIWPRIFADTAQREMVVYEANSAASNVVFALCLQVLEPNLTFAEAMNRAFGEPRLFAPNPALAQRYDANYATYKKFVACALLVNKAPKDFL